MVVLVAAGLSPLARLQEGNIKKVVLRPLLGVDRVEVPSGDTSREIQVGQMLGKTLCGKTGETPDQGEVFEKSGSGTSFTIGRLLTWNGWVGFFFVQYSALCSPPVLEHADRDISL